MDEKKQMVIEKPVLTDAGGVEFIQETLIEGSVIAGPDGHRYKVVRNHHGDLFKRSLGAFGGQAGARESIEPADFSAQTLRTAQAQIGEVSDELKTLLGLPPGREFVAPQLQIQNIQKLYLGRFNEALRSKLMPGLGSSTIYQEQITLKELRGLPNELSGEGRPSSWGHGNDEDKTMIGSAAIFGGVRVADPAHREAAIQKLIDAANDLATKGYIRGVFLPLSSMIVEVQQEKEAPASYLERLLAPVIRHDEVILFYLYSLWGLDVMKMYPNLFWLEGQMPEVFVP